MFANDRDFCHRCGYLLDIFFLFLRWYRLLWKYFDVFARKDCRNAIGFSEISKCQSVENECQFVIIKGKRLDALVNERQIDR